MRRCIAIILALALIFCLCSCGKKEAEVKERECGLYITVEADDIYTVSCGTEDGSDSFENADKSPIETGTVIHFDFGGDAAEKAQENIIDYTVCIYDKQLNIIETKSFSDDFGNMARVNVTVTEDHHIIREGHVLTCGGDLSVAMTNEASDTLAFNRPLVSLPDNSEAESSVNDEIARLYDELFNDIYNSKKAEYDSYMAADDGSKKEEKDATFTLTRSTSITRGSADILSLRIIDTTVIGGVSSSSLQGVNFDLETGKVIGLADISKDGKSLTDYISESLLIATTEDEMFTADNIVFNGGYTELIPTLIADGNWYFTDEGLTVILNPGTIADASRGYFEYAIPYSELEELIDEKYLPVELDGDDGDVTGYNYSDCDMSELTIVGSEPNAAANPVMIAVTGDIYNVRVQNVTYNAADGSYTPGALRWYCSNLSDGAVFAIEHEFVDAVPNLMLSFTDPDGSEQVRLFMQSGESGAVITLDPNSAESGTVISSHFPYTADINGDGSDETINSSAAADGARKISVEAGGKTSTFATLITSSLDVRLYDLNADGKDEIYVSGKTASGETVCYCLSFDGSLHALSFDGAEYANGAVSEFKNGALVIDGKYSILGTYNAKISYTLGSEGFSVSAAQPVSFTDNDKFITLSRSLALSEDQTLNAGESIKLTATDGNGLVYFVTESGAEGSITLTRSGSGWQINGEDAAGYFESLPNA